MTDAASGAATDQPGGTHEADPTAAAGADPSAVHFATAKGFSRGYDHIEVDAFVAQHSSVVELLERELAEARAEIARLRERIDRDSRSGEVKHALSVLTTAQLTADSTIAEADAYSARVMAAAKDLYDDTRRNAAILEQETEAKVRAVYDDAVASAATEQKALEQRIGALTVDATVAQQRLDGQTAYLRTLRDATRTQMRVFLEGLLDHLADEYGHAHPAAAKAANETAGPAAVPGGGAGGAVGGTVSGSVGGPANGTVGPRSRGRGPEFLAGVRLSAKQAPRRTRTNAPSIPRPRYPRGAEFGTGSPAGRYSSPAV